MKQNRIISLTAPSPISTFNHQDKSACDAQVTVRNRWEDYAYAKHLISQRENSDVTDSKHGA